VTPRAVWDVVVGSTEPASTLVRSRDEGVTFADAGRVPIANARYGVLERGGAAPPFAAMWNLTGIYVTDAAGRLTRLSPPVPPKGTIGDLCGVAVLADRSGAPEVLAAYAVTGPAAARPFLYDVAHRRWRALPEVRTAAFRPAWSGLATLDTIAAPALRTAYFTSYAGGSLGVPLLRYRAP
jgi:hypothetical protein